MKIISIGSDPTAFKGSSPLVERLSKQLGANNSLSAYIFTPRGYSDVSHAPNLSIKASGAPYKLASPLFVFWRIIVSGEVPDVATSQDPFESGLVALAVSRVLRVPLQVQVHTDLYSPFFTRKSYLNRLRLLTANFVLPRATRIRVVSERIRNSIVSKWPQLGGRVDVLPVFSKEAAASPYLREAEYLRFCDRHPFRVLTMSRLSYEKNIAMAINALAIARSRYKDIGLVVVGSGKEEESLKALVKDKLLEDHVYFAGWVEDRSTFFKSCQVFLNTSFYEGYCLSLFEAIGHAVPIVSTDVGLVGEILDNTQCVIVPFDDPSTLAASISTLRQNPGMLRLLQKKMAQIGTRASEVEYFSKYREILERCLSASSRKTNGRPVVDWLLRLVRQIHKDHRTVRYLIAGGIAASVHLGLLFILTSFFSVWYIVSTTFAIIAASVVSFLSHKFWTFKDKDVSKINLQTAYYLAMQGANVLINLGLMYILVDKLGFWYMTAQIISSGAIAFESYLVYRFFVFKSKR
jgi:glycosyltransferase involved in cell wall biosynthesis/putative flippase GtrA